MSIVATLHDVSKTYRGTPLFEGVDLEVHEGRIHGLQGHNGSGKTVLLKILTRFVRPDGGEVRLREDFLDRGRVYPKDFGVIIDRPGYVAGLTGIDNLRRLSAIRGVIGDPQIRAAMERVGLRPDAPQKVRNYSLGMKQRLALAQTFMEDQRVLVLDEPFNALDADGVALVRDLLHELRDRGRTVVFTSHNNEDMDVLADSVHRIDRRRLEQVR